MVSRSIVNDFITQDKLAIVGVSRGGKGFGNAALKELKAKGRTVYVVHPQAQMIEDEKCYPSLDALPEPVDGVIIVVPPEQTERVVRDAYAAGIRRVWIQQGAESDEALAFCREHQISTVYGECILMFSEPAAFFHRAHRFVKGMTGQLPR